MAIEIEMKYHPNASNIFCLEADRIIAGRDPSCDLYLDAITPSRRHFQLIRQGDGYAIEDLGSRSGTYVNDEHVSTGNRLLLSNGDSIRAGNLMLVYRDTDG